MCLHKCVATILGNLAMGIWFFPYFSKLLHSIRGVNFKQRSSVFIGPKVLIDNRYPELVFIGNDVWLTAGCMILTHSYSSQSQRILFNLNEMTGNVVIEDGVFIGAGSIICPNVIVSKNSYVACGSVVTKNVPSGVLVAGNPARVIKSL